MGFTPPKEHCRLPDSNGKLNIALLVGLALIPQQAMRQALRAEGFAHIHEAGNGVEAAAILASELVDVVFTGGGEGSSPAELLAALAGRGPNREAALVLLDEGLPREQVVAAVKAGAAGVLPVPPEPEALRRLLDEIAGRAGLPRAKRAN